MSDVRAGVVGVGHLGYHHARNYAALPGVKLVGIFDPDPVRRGKAAEDFGTPACSSIDELISLGAEAVSVSAPTRAHGDATLQLLSAGVDVLVEKPIAATLDEARAMVAMATEKGRILQVGHIERFNGAVMALSKVVRAPRFIECHRLSPYPSRGDDVSVVLDLMIHDLDIVLAFAGPDVVSVDAVGVSVFSQYEDIANARIRFGSGCVVNLTSSRVSPERMRKIRIFEPEAYFSTNYAEQEVLVYRKKPGAIPAGLTPMDMVMVEPLAVERDEPLKRELASFVECVRERRRPVVSGEDGLAALELAERIVTTIREHV